MLSKQVAQQVAGSCYDTLHAGCLLKGLRTHCCRHGVLYVPLSMNESQACRTHPPSACSCGCNYIKQWDMSRAVPRHVRDIKLFTGDILGLCTGNNRLFACTSRGSIK